MERLFKHMGSIGDMIYSLPAIIACGGGDLWIQKKNIWLNCHRMFEKQPYLRKVVSENGYRPSEFYNFNQFREMERVSRGQGNIKHLAKYFLEIVGKDFDLSQPWMKVEKKRASSIVISRTHRYHDSEEVDWTLLRNLQSLCTFVGWHGEYRLFRKHTGLDSVEFYRSKDMLDIAEVIAGADLFIGNQSACFAVAEALKVNRVLEVFKANPNCMPNSSNGHTELTIEIVGKYVSYS